MKSWSAEEILPPQRKTTCKTNATPKILKNAPPKAAAASTCCADSSAGERKPAVRGTAKADIKEEISEDKEEETVEEEETVTRAIIHAEATKEEDEDEGVNEEKHLPIEEEIKTCEEKQEMKEAKIEVTAIREDKTEEAMEELEENTAGDAEKGEGEEQPAHAGDAKKKRKRRNVKKVKKAPPAKADDGRAVGRMQVSPEVPEGDSEGWTVVARNKKRRRKVRAQPSLPEDTVVKAAEEPEPPKGDSEGWMVVGRGKDRPRKVRARPSLPEVPEVKAAIESPRRRQELKAMKRKQKVKRAGQQRALDSVRHSWQEEEAEATLPVAPHMRRLIVGPRGATLREVCQEFTGVRVSVPPPSDTRTATVSVRGPVRQVPAALARLKALLRQAEVIEAKVEVTPRQRRHVVGPAGATVRRLLQEFPDVLVRVPPPADLASRTVLLRGPRPQVTGAEAFVRGCLEDAEHAHRHAYAAHRHAYAAHRHAYAAHRHAHQ